jgi:hypothetical protein
MSNWGRRPITDAGKAKAKPPHITYMFEGEERIDRRPLGRVERFVDPQGNVMSLQLAGDGDPMRQMTADRLRMQYRRDGFVEHAKCPYRHGTALTPGTQTAKDFGKLTEAGMSVAPCQADPKTLINSGGDLHATKACSHIEALIAHRMKAAAAQNKKQNAARIAQEKRDEEKRELERLQLEMAKEQIEERKARKAGKPQTAARE